MNATNVSLKKGSEKERLVLSTIGSLVKTVTIYQLSTSYLILLTCLVININNYSIYKYVLDFSLSVLRRNK